jgi:hypothetical protein
VKAINFLTIIISMIGILGCKKDDVKATYNPNVEKYIQLLKGNQYDSINLPAFTYQDIPALLNYRTETQTISDFPKNGISSYYMPNCTLGMYVLWTIESIRAVAINSKSLMMRFPSQNPILAFRNSQELKMAFDNSSQDIAAQAYFDWWNDNTRKDFNQFKNIDPLQKTNYKWH